MEHHYTTVRRYWDDERVDVHTDVSDRALGAFAEELLALCEPRHDERALDVGCGDGQLAALVRRHVAQVDGLDFAAHRVANAAARLPDGTFWTQSFVDPYPA